MSADAYNFNDHQITYRVDFVKKDKKTHKNGSFSTQKDSNAGRVFLSWRYHAMYSNIQYIINNI